MRQFSRSPSFTREGLRKFGYTHFGGIDTSRTRPLKEVVKGYTDCREGDVIVAKFAAAGKEPPKNWREKYVEPSPPETGGLPELPEEWR